MVVRMVVRMTVRMGVRMGVRMTVLLWVCGWLCVRALLWVCGSPVCRECIRNRPWIRQNTLFYTPVHWTFCAFAITSHPCEGGL